MPYGNTARHVRAFEFGCRAPVEGEAEAVDQMHRRVALWNRLVELDQQYAPRREALIAPHITAPEDDERERREQRRAAFKLPEIQAALRALDKEEYEEARILWCDAGLYWCNHEEVKNTWLQARRRPGTLRFHAWRAARGKTTVRFQTGLPVAEAFSGNDTRLRLTPVDDAAAYDSPVRSERRRAARSALSIRVGSDGRAPIWFILPCVLHRQLPSDGLIRSASVLREVVATHVRYRLVLIVETPEPQPIERAPLGVGIDVGWRRLPEGLRVCAWHDDASRSGEVVLDNRWLNGMAQVDNLRSIRDRHFNAARDALVTWRGKAEGLPEWFREATATLSQWRSPARLAALALRWREACFAGDEGACEAAEAWRQQDKHLYEYESHLRDKLLKRRREQYRVFAARLARTYTHVMLEDFDLRNVARVKGDYAQGGDLPAGARHYRQLAAVSTLRLAIENACEREGVKLRWGEAAYTTQTCQDCGYVYAFDAVREIVTTCPACGVRIDQDVRAAMNLMAAS